MPRLAEPRDYPAILALIRAAFAYMDGKVDPPSSMHRLDLAAVEAQARSGEIWVIGPPGAPVACAFLSLRADAIYLGKLAVAAVARGRGHARALVECAAARAASARLEWLELQVRVELAENQAAFAVMGFAEVARTAHEGFDRPTSVTMRRAVSNPAPR